VKHGKVPVAIRPPAASDEAAFLVAVASSRKLHSHWVQPPNSAAAFRRYLAKLSSPNFAAFFICTMDRPPGLVGVVNISEIVRGGFQSAYLGYYAFEPFAGRGLMSAGLALVLKTAVRDLGLHRLEANIQPSNTLSRKLVKRLGFTREGFSPRYLKIAGRWRDHERWALLREHY
jgi:ribosomal-protein-alanine N-acetyltransferase